MGKVDNGFWQGMPGAGSAVAASGPHVWGLSNAATLGGFHVERFDPQHLTWRTIPGAGGVAIALQSDTPWVLDGLRGIYRWNGETFIPTPGAAIDLAAGGRDEVWCVGIIGVPGGCSIHRWDGRDWKPMPGGGSRIAIDIAGIPWMANVYRHIFRWNWDRENWDLMPGKARDIGAGEAGVWAIGDYDVPGGYGASLHRWNGTDWDLSDGSGVCIDVGNNPWLVNSAKQYWIWKPR